jgi:hypothetical protein
MNSCGRAAHQVLEFGSTPTGPAAAYPPKLCHFMSDLLVDSAAGIASAAEARGTANVISEGRVKRHALRGDTSDSAREIKRAEDEAALAGMRNPASVCKAWPALVTAMRPVQVALLQWHRAHSTFRGLAGVCGSEPSRAAPSDKAVRAMRAQVSVAVGLTAAKGEEANPSSTWKYQLVRSTQTLCEDPDVHLSTWLEEGAPMGLARPIERSGLFPETLPCLALISL